MSLRWWILSQQTTRGCMTGHFSKQAALCQWHSIGFPNEFSWMLSGKFTSVMSLVMGHRLWLRTSQKVFKWIPVSGQGSGREARGIDEDGPMCSMSFWNIEPLRRAQHACRSKPPGISSHIGINYVTCVRQNIKEKKSRKTKSNMLFASKKI